MNSALAKRLVRWIGYPLFAFLCFIIFLYITFPYDKVKDQIEQLLSASGEMTVTIEDLGPSPLFGLSAKRVLIVLTPKPTSFGSPASSAMGSPPAAKPKPTRLVLDRVKLRAGLLAFLRGAMDVGFDVEGMGSEISGRYEAEKKKGWALTLALERLDLSSLPAVKEHIGLPAKGVLTGEIVLDVPRDVWAEASGTITIECEDCSIGDGKAKLKIPGSPLSGEGIPLSRVHLGRFGGQIKVEKGLATFENFSAKSPDIELALEGTVGLRDPVAYSISQAYVRFKISSELKKRDAVFELLEGAVGLGKRPDGFFGVRLMGPLKRLQPTLSPIGPRSGDKPLRARASAGFRHSR